MMRLDVVGQKSKALFVVLLPTLECNLACTYCFEKHPKGRWDAAATERIVDQIVALALAERTSDVRLQWQGGEALLLGVDYWARVLEYAEVACRDARLVLHQTLQTNLVAYDSDFGAIVRRYFDGKVGTSFEDAPGRRFLEGDHHRFVRAFRQAFARARADGLEVGVISLLNDAAIEEGAGSFLTRMREVHGFDRLRVNLPFQQGDSGGYWVDPVLAGEFLRDAYRFWVARGRDRYLYLKPMQYLEDVLTTGTSSEPGLCIFARNCSDVALTITTSGDVSLCDSFAFSGQAEPYGNVFREPLPHIYRGQRRQKVHDLCSSLVADKCLDCRFLPTCHGGCLVRARGALGEDPEFHYCETYKLLFAAIEQEAQGGGSALAS